MNMPLVSVLIATYFPNKEFFTKQLISINNQTYKNIEIIVQDDSSNEEKYIEVCTVVKEHINKFCSYIDRNDKNLGSNKTFEKLTNLANGKFIAYCDQDDIWTLNKIELLVNKALNGNFNLTYSDLCLIDSTDKVIKKSFKKSSFRLKHVYGDDTFKFLINRNSVTGCAMLIKTKIAKASIPFPDQEVFVHDHWLAINSALDSSIGYIAKPLVSYRLHNSNQIGNSRLSEIDNIEDYKNKRHTNQIDRYLLIKKLSLNMSQETIIEKNIMLVQQRIKYSETKSLKDGFRLIYLNRKDMILSTFEIILFKVPYKWGNLILKFLKK